MPLLNARERARLIANGQCQKVVRGTAREIDFKPAVKLFPSDANATWLLSEIDPDYPDLAFGFATSARALAAAAAAARSCHAGEFAQALIDGQDPRIKYVIWDRRMANASAKSGKPPWSWRPYTAVRYRRCLAGDLRATIAGVPGAALLRRFLDGPGAT